MTVSFPKLGSLGRTGNQFFQFAAAYAYSRRHGHGLAGRWVCAYTARDFGRMFGISFHDAGPVTVAWNESKFSYQEIPAYPGMNVSLEGYFQSERYFSDFSDEIRSVISVGAGQSPRPDTCSVHVRRGDYLRLQEYHPCPDMSYYMDAVSEMRSRGAEKFVIFSDDPQWCETSLAPHLGANVSVEPPGADLDDLGKMRSCAYHVIANSSFSWWGAWLSKAENVIAPARWFGPKGPQDSQDVCPPGWTRI